MFAPLYQITPAITTALMRVESDRQAISDLPIAGGRAPRQRRDLALFRRQGTATAGEIAAHLCLSARTVVALCRGWRATGFLSLHDLLARTAPTS